MSDQDEAKRLAKIIKKLRQVGYYELADTIEALTAENAALRKDAERYRWLRSASLENGQIPSINWWDDILADTLNETFDETVDAAIDKAKQ